MIQDANKNQFYVTQDVDAYTDNVDDLMDDLFGEVENTLHVDYAKRRSLNQKNSNTKKSAPYASANSSSSDIVAIARTDKSEREITNSKDTVSITKMNVADISLPPISKQDILWIQPYIMQNPEPPTNNPTNNEVPVSKSSLWDRLLLVAACSATLLAAVMWTVNHGIWLGKQSVSKVAVVDSKAQETSNKAFAEEVKQMLAEVTAKNRAIAANPNLALGTGLAAAPLIGNIPVVGNNPFANGLQAPIYVPVYQPPTVNPSGNNGIAGNAPSPLALPPVTASNSVNVAANNAPVTNVNPSPNVAAAAPITAPVPSYTLIGVLDLGDRSTAMFDISGSVQSIGLGKQIGNTGWSLFRVSQQEITLKRGKETKNVFVGQKF